MDIRDYQRWFEEYDEKRGWDMVEPSHVLAHLMEEVGEIARHVLRLDGYRDTGETEREQEIEALALELNDAFIFLTKLAIYYDIEWADVLKQGQIKAEERFDVEQGRAEMERYLDARRERFEELLGE